jgi:flagellar hook-length control protein FliK
MHMEAAPATSAPATPAAPAAPAPGPGTSTAPAATAHAGGHTATGKATPAGTVATGSRALFAVLLAQQEGATKAGATPARAGTATAAKATACPDTGKAHAAKGDGKHDDDAGATDATGLATAAVVPVPAAAPAATPDKSAKACPATPAQAASATPAPTGSAASPQAVTPTLGPDAVKADAAGSVPATATTEPTATVPATTASDPVPAATAPSVVVSGLRPITPTTTTVKPPSRPTGSRQPADAGPIGSTPAAGTTAARHPAPHLEARMEAAAGPADRSADRGATGPQQPVVQVAPRREAPGDMSQAPQLPAPLDRERFDRLVDGLAARLKLSQAGDGARVRMQLDPKELGEVVVRLQIRDGVAQASLIADNRDAGRVLQSAIADLRSGLADRGVQLDRVDVRVAGDGAGRQHEPRNSHGHHHGHRHAAGGLFAQIGATDPGISTPDPAVPAGSVSILA